MHPSSGFGLLCIHASMHIPAIFASAKSRLLCIQRFSLHASNRRFPIASHSDCASNSCDVRSSCFSCIHLQAQRLRSMLICDSRLIHVPCIYAQRLRCILPLHPYMHSDCAACLHGLAALLAQFFCTGHGSCSQGPSGRGSRTHDEDAGHASLASDERLTSSCSQGGVVIGKVPAGAGRKFGNIVCCCLFICFYNAFAADICVGFFGSTKETNTYVNNKCMVKAQTQPV